MTDEEFHIIYLDDVQTGRVSELEEFNPKVTEARLYADYSPWQQTTVTVAPGAKVEISYWDWKKAQIRAAIDDWWWDYRRYFDAIRYYWHKLWRGDGA